MDWDFLTDRQKDSVIYNLKRLAYAKANLDEVIDEGAYFIVKLSDKDYWISKAGPFWSYSPIKKWNIYAKCNGKDELLSALVELLGDFDVDHRETLKILSAYET